MKSDDIYITPTGNRGLICPDDAATAAELKKLLDGDQQFHPLYDGSDLESLELA